MANFLTEATELWFKEGFYSNDPDDAGKETIWGISRAANPDNELWSLVDAWKGTPGFPENMRNDQAIRLKCLAIGRARYWDAIRGDEIPSQAIAQALFDCAYNLGQNPKALEKVVTKLPVTAGAQISIAWLQRGLNELNVDGTKYADVEVDGVFGPGTMTALQQLLSSVDEGEMALWFSMNVLKGVHYLDASKEKYVKGLELQRTFEPRTMRRLFPFKFGRYASS